MAKDSKLILSSFAVTTILYFLTATDSQFDVPVQKRCECACDPVVCPKHEDAVEPVGQPVKTVRIPSVKPLPKNYINWVDGKEFEAAGNNKTIVAGRVSDKVWLHHYSAMYEKYLAPYRDAGHDYQMLEIGMGPNGRSQHLYKAFAPNIHYHCLEAYFLHEERLTKTELKEEERQYLRDHCVLGDQASASDLNKVNEKFGPFDIIIDDGSHFTHHQLFTFKHMFPLLKPGGTYIIEDLQTNYNPKFGGTQANQEKRETMVEMIKDMYLALHYHWWAEESYGQKVHVPFTLHDKYVEWIQTIDCDREICTIRKRTKPLRKIKKTAM